MKKLFLIIVLFISPIGFLFAQDSIQIYGQVTDFNHQVLDSVTVTLKNKQFNDIAITTTDHKGNYSMTVPKGNYYCLYAVKSSEYFKTKLEYWTWNVPAYDNLNINPQYGNMEVYGINVSEPQVTPYETYMIYFRPMSLKKILALSNLEKRKDFEHKANQNHDTVNIAPKKIFPEELSVKINGAKSKVVSVNKVVEYGRGAYIYGYNIQVLKPKKNEEALLKNERIDGYDKISITLHSKETNEIGKAEHFYKKIKYID